MGKGNMLMGNFSGKLGDMVFFRANGEQRNRTYLRRIKNPKTVLQTRQRVKIASFAAAYRIFLPLTKESFITRDKSESSFNAFVRQNFANYAAITKTGVEIARSTGLAPLRPYQITSGGLSDKFTTISQISGAITAASLTNIDPSAINVISNYGNDKTTDLMIAISPNLINIALGEVISQDPTALSVTISFGKLVEKILTYLSGEINIHLAIDVPYVAELSSFTEIQGITAQFPSTHALYGSTYLEVFDPGDFNEVQLTFTRTAVDVAWTMTAATGTDMTTGIAYSASYLGNNFTFAMDFSSLATGRRKIAGAAVWVVQRGTTRDTSTSVINLLPEYMTEAAAYQSRDAMDAAVESYLVSSDGDGYVFKG